MDTVRKRNKKYDIYDTLGRKVGKQGDQKARPKQAKSKRPTNHRRLLNLSQSVLLLTLLSLPAPSSVCLSVKADRLGCSLYSRIFPLLFLSPPPLPPSSPLSTHLLHYQGSVLESDISSFSFSCLSYLFLGTLFCFSPPSRR